MIPWKTPVLHCVFACILAGICGVIYNLFYCRIWGCDFSEIVHPLGIFSAYLFLSIALCGIYFIFGKWQGKQVFKWINLSFSLVFFMGVFLIFMIRLPLDIEHPELFPALAIPLELFPVIAFYTLIPFFNYQSALK